jgi:hypothetical protein
VAARHKTYQNMVLPAIRCGRLFSCKQKMFQTRNGKELSTQEDERLDWRSLKQRVCIFLHHTASIVCFVLYLLHSICIVLHTSVKTQAHHLIVIKMILVLAAITVRRSRNESGHAVPCEPQREEIECQLRTIAGNLPYTPYIV